jgi:hypothetical protein
MKVVSLRSYLNSFLHNGVLLSRMDVHTPPHPREPGLVEGGQPRGLIT